MAHNLRKRLNKLLKFNGKSHIVNLGCSVEQLKKYLESKFQVGMTWDNYGKWHVDHIKPLSKFDIANYKEACHYTNLQPLWAKDNIRKGNK